jgi:ankyrin repeat protein
MALIYAAGNGHADCVRLLLDSGADSNARNKVRVGGSFAGYLLISHILYHFFAAFLYFSTNLSVSGFFSF